VRVCETTSIEGEGKGVIRYDSKTDILTIKLKEGLHGDERLLDSDVVLGFDKKGNIF